MMCLTERSSLLFLFELSSLLYIYIALQYMRVDEILLMGAHRSPFPFRSRYWSFSSFLHTSATSFSVVSAVGQLLGLSSHQALAKFLSFVVVRSCAAINKQTARTGAILLGSISAPKLAAGVIRK
jgi:hypothetical protein